jgi:hypothetical protein
LNARECISVTPRVWRAGLLHFLLGAIAFAGDDVVFERLVLLVLDAQRLAFVVHQLHAQLAIGAVLLGVGGPVDQLVFGADVLVDLLEKMSGISPEKRGK